MDLKSWTESEKLIDWTEKMQTLCKPDQVHLCDGSHEESVEFNVWN